MRSSTEPPQVAVISFRDNLLHALSYNHGTMLCGVAPDWWMAGPSRAVARKADNWCEECFPQHPPLSPKDWATMSHEAPQQAADTHREGGP